MRTPTFTFRPLRLLALLGAQLLTWLLLLGHPGAAQASLLHFSGTQPADLGLHDGRLRDCPSPAHCARQDWPLANPEAALQQLALELEATPGVRIETRVDSPGSAICMPPPKAGCSVLSTIWNWRWMDPAPAFRRARNPAWEIPTWV